MSSANLVICGNQTPANNLDYGALTPEADLQAFMTAHCLLVAEKPGAGDCPCSNPCSERVYDSTVSASSPWPDPSFQQDFYERFIKGSTYAYKFKPYEFIMEAYNNGFMTLTKEANDCASTNTIRRPTTINLLTQ